MTTMTKQTLFRASFELQPTNGRNLTGLAMPWERPTLVRDLIGGRVGPPYLEAFAPSSCDVTIGRAAERPVFVGHEYNFGPADPIGVVSFQRSEEGLLFDAHLSKTSRADEMLELVNDGAMRSVSVGFKPINAAKRMTPEGQLTMRTEVALRELSLAPTGFGQYAEAGVLAVRQLGPDPTFNDIREAVEAAIERLLFGEEASRPDGCYLWIRDITDTWAVYEYEKVGEDRSLYRVGYTIDGDGEVALDEPEPVVVSYASITRSAIDKFHRETKGFLASHPVPHVPEG